ncbi:MAG TPA: hypothetical protein VK174_14715 [Chitinophagales bacterium]|nr:hypothetical protein [Chitinophagales bacterium]
MPQIPLHISALFISLVFAIAFILLIAVYVSSRRSVDLSFEERRNNFVISLIVIMVWLIFTLIMSASGFLTDFSAMPPRLLLIVAPPLVFFLVLLNAKQFNDLTEQFNVFWLVYIQSFRILMEFILWLLYRYNVIPVQMTFEGRNLDVLVGITAPFIAYYCFIKKTWPLRVALIWNFVGIALLLNIVLVAILSTPYPFRYFMNEPANTVVFYFPFIWLPAFVVPFALLLHLVAIRRLWKFA